MNVLELLLIEIEHFRDFFEQFYRLHNEIVEIQRIVAAQAFLIHWIYLCNNSFKIVPNLLLILLWSNQFIFCCANHSLDCFRLKFLGIDVQFLHTIPNNGELIRGIQNREIRGKADPLNFSP
ncbi:hypothetical protein D3C78_1213040 [compost metagenome]